MTSTPERDALTPAEVEKAAQVLSDAGLKGHVDSWISLGPNKEVTPEQLTEALGVETLEKVAQEQGIQPRQAAAEAAEALPVVIDEMTPSGRFLQEGEKDLGQALTSLVQATSNTLITLVHTLLPVTNLASEPAPTPAQLLPDLGDK